ncbi:hypothetical protein GR156_16620 [Shinella zoogloeoides]|uniref:Transcription factor zinc-finger domain-containing protein n=2 Tax=Rhizobiaceae TaxID=82115 RepID=A0A6N8TI98_SHIZO|nr:hypothetical protein SHLA_45c000110 [Shinella sp. DD12]MXO01946.1 hypothetical protein [Shinella zoogloeoides]TAA49815.1 hypothetical protein EXZ48_33845 [Shinella sp. JR1-6]
MSSGNASETGLLCPSCRVNLVMSERQGIEIDYCPQCRGVWLDRGELDKIIDRSLGIGLATPKESGQSAQVQQISHGHRSDHGHSSHGYERGDRHRSFLGRLFD